MEINLKLLKKILLTERPPGKEFKMISLILNHCQKIPNISYILDEENNLFVTKNTNNQKYVSCIIAHMDQIITHRGPRVISIRNGEIRGFHKEDHSQCSLGADDGLGICIALQLLEVLEDVKVLFTIQEEIGGTGAYVACINKKFFDNVNFFVQADRRGASDLIVHTNGIYTASDEFVNDIQDLTKKYGYFCNYGTFTDVGILSESFFISGVNISCGYYNEHSKEEYTIISDTENCLNYIFEILTKLNNHNPYIINVNKHLSYPYYSDISEEITEMCYKCRNFDCLNCKWYNML